MVLGSGGAVRLGDLMTCVGPAGEALIGFLLNVVASPTLRAGGRRLRYTWNCINKTEDARA